MIFHTYSQFCEPKYNMWTGRFFVDH